MEPMTIRLDSKIRKMLDDYCAEMGVKLSDAFRTLIKDSLERYKKRGEVGFIDSVGPEGLMINEKRAIRASIESTLILRQLAGSLLKDEKIIKEINAEVSRIMKEGWQYDNES